MTMPLHIEGVRKHHAEKTVLDGVDLQVRRGSVLGLLGRNGAGKTTLLQAALGLIPIDGGTIRVFGDSCDDLTLETKARIGYVPQQVDLFGWMTAWQMIQFFKAFYTRWSDAKVASLMERWSIPKNVRISKLSGGEQQRLAIVRALAHEPDLLLLDEPVSSLDPAGRREFLGELIEAAIERETTVIFSTHILSDLERVASHAAFLRDGKILLHEPMDTLTQFTRRLIGPLDAFARVSLAGEVSRTVDGAGLVSIMARVSEGDAALLEELRRRGVRDEPMALEDFFIEATKS